MSDGTEYAPSKPFWGTLSGWRNEQSRISRLSKAKCEVIPLGKNNPTHQYRLGADQLAEKDTKLVTSHQCALAAKIGASLLLCVRKSTASKAREVILPLCSAP